jgi:hypothetical protein
MRATTPKYVQGKTEVHSFHIPYPGSYQVRWCTYVAPCILLCRLDRLQVNTDTAPWYTRVVTIVLPQISKIMMRKPAAEEGRLQSWDNSKHFNAFNETHVFPVMLITSLLLVSNAWNLSQMNPVNGSPIFLKKFIKHYPPTSRFQVVSSLLQWHLG